MKKILFFLLCALSFMSCNNPTLRNDEVIITGIKIINGDFGKYEVTTNGAIISGYGVLKFYTNELYSVGDTLKISKTLK